MRKILKKARDAVVAPFAAMAVMSVMASLNGIEPRDIFKEILKGFLQGAFMVLIPTLLVMNLIVSMPILLDYSRYDIPCDFNYWVTFFLVYCTCFALWFLAMTGFAKIIDLDK